SCQAPERPVTQTAATLLVGAACLFAVGLFALNHRRDALGAVLAVILGFDAVACALVGFAGLASTRVEAAQLQSFALLVEILGALFAGAGIALAALLRRRTGGPDLLELALAESPQAPTRELEAEPEPEPAQLEEPGADEDGTDNPAEPVASAEGEEA
ncbi:MAG: hypothetical protein WBA31_03580, partial [Candidatus Dormiibacterota bacterium]